MKNNITNNYCKKEKGIALIFTIGLLALISALAILYVGTTSLNNKAAKNHNDLASARMLARSAVNRAMVAMKLYTGDLNNLKSRSVDYSLTSTEATEDLIFHLPTTVKGVEYYTEANYTAATPKPTWHYIKITNTSGTDVIVGRISFAVAQVASESGWIIIGATVDSGQTAKDWNDSHSGSSNDINAVTEYGSPSSSQSAITDLPYTSVGIDGQPKLGRHGRDVSEISLELLHEDKPGGFLTDTHLKKMSSEEAIPAGKMPITGWGSSDAYFDALNIKDDETKNKHLEYFSFGNPEDIEAFWIDTHDLDVKNNDELYHRFNLARTDWDTLTVNDIISPPDRFYDSNDNIIETNTKSISWLNNWKTAGDMVTIPAAKNQIAANLIDYCDANDEATTDNENHPSYVGVEKCPYINEIRIKFTGTSQYSADHGVNANIVPEFVSAEVINLYNTGDTIYNLTAHITMEWEFTLDETTYSESETASIPLPNLTGQSYSFTANTYKFDDQGYTYIDYIPTSKSVGELGINNLRITKLNVKLVGKTIDETTDKFYDYAYIDYSNYTDSDIADSDYADSDVESNTFFAYADAGSKSAYFIFQAADPRQNLHPADWKREYSTDTDPGTLGSNNTNFLPNTAGTYGTDSDRENSDVVYPWQISTAYIRNAPMKSPWELGAIHRGTAWQTINLKKYNYNQGKSGGGNKYNDESTINSGDANILDQIKMSDNFTTLGKINLNVTEQLILKTLFYGIYTNSGYESPSAQDSAPTYMLTEAMAESLADETLTETSADNFKTRAEILTNIESFSDNNLGLVQTNDAVQEEIIGKFINLTKADEIKTNQVTIIAIAQTIDDIGGGITVYNDLNQDGDILDANEKIINTQFGVYDQYADKITATQKVLIKLYENPTTSELGIRRFEYIDN
jgi:hypothetical protein